MKESMQGSKLIETSIDDLKKELLSLSSSYFRLRVQKMTNQLKQTHLLRQTRRNIARVKTRIRKKTGKQ